MQFRKVKHSIPEMDTVVGCSRTTIKKHEYVNSEGIAGARVESGRLKLIQKQAVLDIFACQQLTHS